MKVMIFDVGGTEIKYSVMDDAMNRYESGSIPTPSDSQPHFLETLAQLYRPHRDEVDGIALSLPGFIDAEHGVVRGGGAPSITYNIGTPVGPRLAELCGCKVWIENDGKAAAIAELQCGALQGCSNAAVFVIGTGVGGGLIVNGQLVRGRDFTAGEYSFMNTNADAWGDGKKTMACQCSTSALLDAYRDTSLSSALSLLEQVLPLITTDMTDREILGYAVSLFPLMTGGEVVSQHIPAAGTYASRNIDGMAVLVADLEANRQVLKDTLGG